MAEELGVELSYASEVYEERTMKRLLGHLEVVLWEVAERPEVKVRELSLLRGEERRQTGELRAHQPRHA